MQCVLTCMGKFAKQRVADGAAPAETGKKVKKGCAPTAKAKGILKTSPSTRDHGIEIGNALDKLMAQNSFSSKEEEQKAKETARGQGQQKPLFQETNCFSVE